MADSVSPERRSQIMGAVRCNGTKPELIVRRAAHRLGYRFRLHRRDLPGTPDLVFASRRKVVFVHGCFWHRHEGCKLARMPKSRIHFWVPKLQANRLRDEASLARLKEFGWDSLVVWECELRKVDDLDLRLIEFLG